MLKQQSSLWASDLETHLPLQTSAPTMPHHLMLRGGASCFSICRALSSLCLECRSYFGTHPARWHSLLKPSRICPVDSAALLWAQLSYHQTQLCPRPFSLLACELFTRSHWVLVCSFVKWGWQRLPQRGAVRTQQGTYSTLPTQHRLTLNWCGHFLSFTFTFTSPQQAAALWGNPPCSLVSGTCWSGLLFEPRKGEQELCRHHSEPLW